MADVRNFKPRLSSSRLFSKGTKDLDSGVVDDKVFNRMTSSFEEKKFLTDEVQFEYSAPLIYQLDLLKEDIDDIHSHLSESKYTSKVQKFPVVDVTEEFFVSGLTQLKGNTRIDGHTDIRGAFKINGTEVSDLKKSLDYARALEATGVTSTEFDYLDGVTSNIQTQIDNAGGSSFTAAGISGSFTSLSASIATDINNAGGGTIDTTLKNGSTNAVQNNAVFDGLALKLNLTGGAMTGLIRPIVTAVTGAPKNNALDASKTNVYEFAASKAITIDAIIPSFSGQEITIMNIGTGAVTLTGTNSAKARSIYHAKGSNYTINQHQAYKLVCNQNQVWYVIS
tara:strand:+ start:276 stop:1289 length:1014 start_codon:yes stop_codon:yes gene_type:complete